MVPVNCINMLYKYIFYKIYFFYIRVFKEKEIPHWFAASIITLILGANILAVIELVLYIFAPDLIDAIGYYFKYFAIFLLGAVLLYVNFKKRYLKFISEVDKLTSRKRRVLGYISIVYVLLVFVCFFGMSNLIRDYNLQ